MTYEELMCKYLESVKYINELLDTQNKLNQTIIELTLTISALNKTIEELKKDKDDSDKSINAINTQLKKLEKKINMNSTNSSCPPSKDDDKTKAKRKTKSLRKKTDKKQGGQPGHKGETAKMSYSPDFTDVNLPKICPNCGYVFNDDEITKTKKQIFDLKMEKIITEYVRGNSVCPKCNCKVETSFPKEAVNPVNYASSIPALTTYLFNYGMMSINRIKEFLHEYASFDISWGTISAYNMKMKNMLNPVKEAFKKAVFRYDIWHVDETGIYVNGKRLWLHTIVAGCYHLLFVHEKRGIEAIKDIGLLEKFRGKVVHDNWTSYQKLENCDHIQCMVHVERTLVSIYEEFKEKECKELLDYIREIYIQREEALSNNVLVFENIKAEEIETKLYEIINRWKENHLKQYPPKPKKGKRGREKRDEAIKMIDRFLNPESKSQYVEWIHDFTIPYTNNRAESSFRLQKVKMNVSGCFRSIEGAQASCDELAFIKTIRELGLSVSESIYKVLNGQYDFLNI